jgi:hypothetical protein
MAAVLAALAGQMALPAAHGLELRRLGLTVVAAPATGDGVPLQLSPVRGHAAAHDPAACPVCQSLLRAGRAGLAPTTRAQAVAQAAAPPSEPCPRTGSCPLRGAHPPRAPPAFLLV